MTWSHAWNHKFVQPVLDSHLPVTLDATVHIGGQYGRATPIHALIGHEHRFVLVVLSWGKFKRGWKSGCPSPRNVALEPKRPVLAPADSVLLSGA